MRIIPLLLLLLLLLPPTLAQSDIKTSLEDARIELEEFFASVPENSVLIIVGRHVSVEEKMLFNLAKDYADQLQRIPIISEKNYEPQADQSLVLIGGEKTNGVTKELLQTGAITNATTSTHQPFTLTKSQAPDGTRRLIIASDKEQRNAANAAITKSPLSRILDEQYVPLVATFISVLLLYLWTILGRTVANLFSDFVSSKLLEKKSATRSIRKEKKEHIKPHEFVNRTEIIAFIIYVLVFTFTMSWTWSEGPQTFKRLLLLNLAIVGIISLLREAVRLTFCYRKRLRSEFVFWPFGTFIAVGSTLLGNTFSTMAYTLLDEDELDEKKFGKGSFYIALATYLFALALYIINLFKPALYLQMGFVFCIMTLFIELFPLRPMPGEEIRQWRKGVWAISYAVIIATYILVNFTVYI